MIHPLHAQRLRRSSAAGLLSLTFLWTGCGGGQTSDEDESSASPEDTRIELVYVDETDSAAADTAAVQPAPPAPTPADEVGGDDLIRYDPDGAYTVQVGTFTDATRARERVRELDTIGYPAYATAHPEGGRVRVRIGYFSTRDQAEGFGQRFTRDHGGQYWIDRRAAEEGTGG